MSPSPAPSRRCCSARSEPVRRADLATAAECDAGELAEALDELRAAYAPGERGLVLRELAGGFTLATTPRPSPRRGGCWPSRARRR